MISEETIAAVRERVDLVALIGENVRLKRQGRRFTGLCPFHKEKTPSFNVNPDRGMYHCFGCKASGGAIDYVMQVEGYTFPEAVRALAERCGVEIEEGGSEAERKQSAQRRQDKEDLFAVMRMAAHFFVEQLQPDGHPLACLARAELERRGLAPGSNEQVDASLSGFHVGYAPYGWDGLASFLRRQEVSPAVAQRLGLVAPRRGGGGFYDAFRHRLMFAVVDKSGRVVAFSGRALAEPDEELLSRHGIAPMSAPRAAGDEPRRPPPKYINSPESPIYIKGEVVFGLHQARHEIRQRAEAVLVEGNFDVLSLHGRGYSGVVAPLGTAFTTAQAKLIKRYAPTTVVLFDADSAGRKATRALRAPAREAGLALKVASLPAGQDPDDFAREQGIEAIEQVVSGAQGMLEYLIEQTLTGDEVRAATLVEQHERIRQVMGYLAEESDPTLRSMAKSYADKISARLVVGGRSAADMGALERMVRAALARGATAQSGASGGPSPDDHPFAPLSDSAPRGPQARSRLHTKHVEMAVFGALLEFPELLDNPQVLDALQHAEGDLALGVDAVRRMWDAKKSLRGPEILDLMPRAIHPFAVGRLASPKFMECDEACTELLENAKKLQWLSLKGDKAAKLEELAHAERMGDTAAEDELLRELTRRSKQKLGL